MNRVSWGLLVVLLLAIITMQLRISRLKVVAQVHQQKRVMCEQELWTTSRMVESLRDEVEITRTQATPVKVNVKELFDFDF